MINQIIVQILGHYPLSSALQIGRNLDRHLLIQDKSNVWVNTEASQRTYRSDYNRPYKQNLTLTQVGVA